MEKYEQFKNGEISGYSMKKRFVRPDGTSVDKYEGFPLIGLPYKHSMHLCLLEDITISVATFAALSESERSKAVFLSHLPD